MQATKTNSGDTMVIQQLYRQHIYPSVQTKIDDNKRLYNATNERY